MPRTRVGRRITRSAFKIRGILLKRCDHEVACWSRDPRPVTAGHEMSWRTPAGQGTARFNFSNVHGHFRAGNFSLFVRVSVCSRRILMQQKVNRIATSFAPEIRFEVLTKADHRAFDIPELLFVPLEKELICKSVKLNERRGIPFSSIND
jgi:hypothetical protein